MPLADPVARAAYKQQWAESNREQVRESHRRSVARDPEGTREYQRQWSARNRDKINEQSARLYAENVEVRLKALVQGARYRAKNAGLAFDISYHDLIWPVVCPVLGIPINYGVKGKKTEAGSPSLDRFDPHGGYTKDNVRVISWRANFLKCNGTVDEFSTLVGFLSSLTESR